jgi:filamentous hemagglutinin
MKLKDIVSRIFIDPRKLTEYALNPDNPKGTDKAIMFQRHLGFTKDNYELLLERIKAIALDAEATLQRTDIHGQRYQVDLEIEGIEPEKKEIVRTGWIVEPNSSLARLVTLYVRKRNESA